jgi:hypothetical protein
MNASTNPSAPSPSSSRSNGCYETDAQAAALNVIADNETSYLLSYAHWLGTERHTNPVLERKPDAPPERMLIRFASAEVVLLGSGLAHIERIIQKCSLKYVRPMSQRFAAMEKTHIVSVTITFNREQS